MCGQTTSRNAVVLREDAIGTKDWAVIHIFCHACFLALLLRPHGLLDFLFRSILATVALNPNISKSVRVIVHVLFSAFPSSACQSWARGLRFGFVDGPLFDFLSAEE